MNAEQVRLQENSSPDQPWHFWGPYLAERAWGTVREDYSADGDAWNFFTHDQARSRAYRWNEDGLAGISDFKGRLCLAFAFWNERDPFLKERLFGLANEQGNHGEDVKEIYWYSDATPTHSYMSMRYRYPQSAFPYDELVRQNAARGRSQPEFEIWDTGVFADNRFFEIQIEYAKASAFDILIQATATNCGAAPATLHVLPTLWFRNTWSWGRDDQKPNLKTRNANLIEATHRALGTYQLAAESVDRFLFTENESNATRLWNLPGEQKFVKDSINDSIVQNRLDVVNALNEGTKAAAHYQFTLGPNESRRIRLRLRRIEDPPPPDALNVSFRDFDTVVAARKAQADAFYAELAPPDLEEDHRLIQRQAFAGLIWNKQFYRYIVEQWLEGDPDPTPPPEDRKHGRNSNWRHIYNDDVISMPDAWEYPWYASWDLAFHCIPLALIDVKFAKTQLDRIVREWYQHPNGQIPAYEWNFGDVNPPVLAWAAWRVFQIERKQAGKGDRAFLETIFHKMLISFTWWVNRKDSGGNNIFQGGFLGLDNIGVFDRSMSFADGTRLEQSDATSWMGMFCLNMLRIAIELALENHVYENIATKFFEHFLAIAAAMNEVAVASGFGMSRMNFTTTCCDTPGGRYLPLKVRSIVGLLPLLAVETIQSELIDSLPGFEARLEWYLTNRPDLASLVSRWQEPGMGERRLVALTRGHRMKCLLRRMLDPNEFLSDYGIRSVSKYHKDHPYVLTVRGETRVVNYEPGESQSGIFGGNSNWRGPVWFPINYLANRIAPEISSLLRRRFQSGMSRPAPVSSCT